MPRLGQRGHGVHHDGAAAFFHFEQHQVVTQAGRGNGGRAVRRVFFQLGLGGITGGKVFAQTVEGFGFEQQEPGTHRAVTVFKAGRRETVFHHGQFGTDLHGHGVGGTGVPYGIPGPAFTFTNRTGLVDVHRAAAGNHHGLAFDDVDDVLAYGETDGAGDLVGHLGIHQQFDDEAALDDVVIAYGQLGGFGDDALVGLTVDHDLPFTGTDRFGAGLQGPHFLTLIAVQVLAVFGFLPDGQAPLFKQVNGIVDIAAQIEDQVFTDQTHQVVAHHAHIVFGSIFANVGVDGGQTLSNGTGSFHGGLVAQQNALAVFHPFFNFKCGTAGSHTTTDDENVNFFFDDFGIPHGLEFTHRFIR